MSNSPDLNNFVHRLPNGYLRAIAVSNRTMDTKLIDRCDETTREHHSEKRLQQTDAEFFAQIDALIVQILASSIDETRQEITTLGVLTTDWGDAFRKWASANAKTRGEPPSDESLVSFRDGITEKYRSVYGALLELGYTDHELTV